MEFIGQLLLSTSNLLFTVLPLLIFARVLLAWFPQYRYTQFGEIVFSLTEPILGPIRSRLPNAGMLDFSPMIAIFVLVALQVIIEQIIRAIFNLYY